MPSNYKGNYCMVKIYCEKTKHTLYNTINEILSHLSLDLDINIIGIDSILSSPFNESNMPEFIKKPFFLYLEEPQYINTTELINHKNFRGFISHIKNACEQLYTKYNKKTYYLPLCMDRKDISRILDHISTLQNRDSVHLLAWGSWNDLADHNFYNRGGNAIDDLALDLLKNDCKVNLTFKTNKNLKCKSTFPNNVKVITKYLSKEEMDNIFYSADVFLLPSKQVHSMSLLYSMSFGLPCIVSNGWGMSEFCSDLNSILYTDIDKIKDIIRDKNKLIHLRKQVLFDLNNRYSKEDYSKRLYNILRDAK